MALQNIIEAFVLIPFGILFWGIIIYFLLDLFSKD